MQENARNIFHEVYYGVEKFLLKRTEDRVFKPSIDKNSFKRIYSFYVFDISNQKDHIAAPTISVGIKFL